MRSYLSDFDLTVAADFGDALRLVAEGSRPMAGGTDLMVLFNAGRLGFKKLVSVAKIPELTAITFTPESVSIGAAVTYSAVQRDPILQAEFPLLGKAAAWTGGLANQNRGTLGGNIVNASPAADSPPALLAYDAELEIVSEAGSGRIPYYEFHTGYKEMQLKPGELLVKIHLPRYGRKLQHYGRKVGARRAQAISKVCLNAVAEVDSNVIRQVRIALGSVAPTPLRCHRVEAALAGQIITSRLITKAREVIAQEIQPIDDIRSTAQYRSLVTQNLLSECLGQWA